jgi:homoserine dehydrogenase
MRKEGRDFADALKSAQQNGYAEANPTADIEGHDACRKIAILSSIAYNEFVDYSGIYTEGITKISLIDMQYADIMDSVIKLIAISKRVGDKIFARVSPAIIGKSHPLATVEDVFNAIVIKGDAIGDAMFYGRGAGKLPTASAVVADVIDIARHMGSGVRNIWVRKEYNNTMDIMESETRFFIRVMTRNTEEARKYILNTFGTVDFIRLDKNEPDGELAFTTIKAAEGKLLKRVNELQGIGSIRNVINTIRIEEE